MGRSRNAVHSHCCIAALMRQLGCAQQQAHQGTRLRCDAACCDCREVARSAELRAFLQVSGDLRRSPAWTALSAPAPTWRHGVQRLLKQMVGREALTPAPAEAARSTGASHDVVRSCREAVYGYRHRGCASD